MSIHCMRLNREEMTITIFWRAPLQQAVPLLRSLEFQSTVHLLVLGWAVLVQAMHIPTHLAVLRIAIRSRLHRTLTPLVNLRTLIVLLETHTITHSLRRVTRTPLLNPRTLIVLLELPIITHFRERLLI
jgi:hypothetical protein